MKILDYVFDFKWHKHKWDKSFYSLQEDLVRGHWELIVSEGCICGKNKSMFWIHLKEKPEVIKIS